MPSRIGIFSGTFDPVHSGHIAFAQEALRSCRLDEVVFLPEQQPRGKEKVTDMVHRVALLQHATADIDGLRVLELEDTQFSVDQTLPKLHKLFPGSQLTLLVGSDVARTFLYRWDGLDTLLADTPVAIGLRSSDEAEDMTAIMYQLSQEYELNADYVILSTPESTMASSHIRSGKVDMTRLHPEALQYMQKHLLYDGISE